MSHSFYPPLMQRTSWTLAAPFKEQQHHRGPSDSIANNYSLTAQDLKLKDLLKVYQPVTVNVPRERLVQGLPSGNRGGAPYELGSACGFGVRSWSLVLAPPLAALTMAHLGEPQSPHPFVMADTTFPVPQTLRHHAPSTVPYALASPDGCVTNHSQTSRCETTTTCYLSVPTGQDPGQRSPGWVWLRVSLRQAVKVSAKAKVTREGSSSRPTPALGLLLPVGP